MAQKPSDDTNEDPESIRPYDGGIAWKMWYEAGGSRNLLRDLFLCALFLMFGGFGLLLARRPRTTRASKEAIEAIEEHERHEIAEVARMLGRTHRDG